MKSRKSRQPEKEKKPQLQSAAFGCTVLAAVLAGVWILFPAEVEKAVRQLPSAVGLRPELADKPPVPLPTQDNKTPEAAVQPAASQADAPPVNQPPPGQPEEQPAPQPVTCSQAAGSLQNFFAELDGKDYVQEFKLRRPARGHLEGLAEKLAARPPAVVRETDDLYTVLSNTVHFFRVIGRDNIRLLKAVLEHEQDRQEELAASLYAASTGPDCPADVARLPFGMAYDYSVFFLNTMGGRSYLFRRESKVRILTAYYSVLLVDEANKRNLNAHGLDISGLIQPLIREIEASSQLARKEEYLARLRGLAERYSCSDIN